MNTDADPGGLDDRSLARGTTVRRYVVLDRIGTGGMGVVYAAYDYGLDRRIALKLVRDRGGETARARLMREAQVLARLSHPNVVAVYDVGEHEGEVYVAMELVEGTSLRAWLAAEPRDWCAILEVFRSAGAGLAAAHAAGIIHRDVKPDNVLIDRQGAVRVGDFGLALVTRDVEDDAGKTGDPRSSVGSVTLTGTAMGTPAYMSPEQHAGRREIDARTDQFGFCVALYEALYGVRPFVGDDRATLCAAIATGRLAPGAPGREVPSWIRRVIVRGMAAEPDARFPSMAALLAELCRDPPGRRRRWVMAAAGLTAAAGLALGAARLAGGDAVASCRMGSAQFSGVWDAPRRAVVHAAFVRSGGPDADQTWTRVERALDERVAGWQQMRVEACEATHVRAEQSAELLDRRMACLDDRVTDLRALTDLFVAADRAAVGHALDAIRGLETVDACARGAVLRAGARPATDAGASERRGRLSRVQAAYSIGDRPRALALARGLASDAHAAGDREIEGQALRTVGLVLMTAGNVPEAQDALYGAIAAAEGDNADTLAAQVWLDLMWLIGDEGGHYDDAHRLARVAQGAIDRLGDASSRLQAIFEDRVGVLYYDQGNYAEAAPHLERGLALREQSFGPLSLEVAISLHHLGLLRRAEGNQPLALELYRRARENAERVLGPTHLDTLVYYLNTEGFALLEAGHNADALAVFQRILAALQRADPDNARVIGVVLTNLGVAQRKQGQLAAARASLERAIALFEHVAGADSVLVATPLSYLALVLADLGQFQPALAQVERALAIQEKRLGKDHPELADTLSTLGSVQMLAHRPGAAIAPIERAIAIRANLASAAHAVAEDRLRLARALAATGVERARAFELTDAARAAFAAEGDAASVRDVDTWRAELGERAVRR